MGEASDRLLDGDGSAALDPQQEALNILESVARELAREAKQVRHEARRHQLSQTRARLEALRGRQVKINATTASIINRLSTRPRLTRLDARKIAAASRAQDALREQAEALRRALKEAVVYDFVLDRVVSGMGVSGDALSSRRIDTKLANGQQGIVVDLNLLIAALTDLNKLPSPDEFARSGGGRRGGTGGQQANVAVPKLAELLVLKAMQESLIVRTREAAQGYDPDTATEQRLQAVRRLADEQQSIRNLTQRVTEKAKNHAN